jgi:hypothetical protein
MILEDEMGMSTTKKNTVKCGWKRPNQYWDILVVIGQFMETLLKRKIGSGRMSLGKTLSSELQYCNALASPMVL